MMQIIRYYMCKYIYGEHKFERHICDRCGIIKQYAPWPNK